MPTLLQSSKTSVDGEKFKAEVRNAKSQRSNQERIDNSRKQTIYLLCGDRFLFQANGLSLPFSGAVGNRYWQIVLSAVKVALRMTPRPERKRDGPFPLILIESVNHCIEERRKSLSGSSLQWEDKLVYRDFSDAIEMMRSQAMLQMGESLRKLVPSLFDATRSLTDDFSFVTLSLSPLNSIEI